nr:MAG TPA: hypothetical protein [Caudoviricetes sp.]
MKSCMFLSTNQIFSSRGFNLHVPLKIVENTW